MSTVPLAGLRVLEFSHTVMGPTAGLILAELGANVVKVEPAPKGDHTRGLGGFALKSHYVPTAERATIVGQQTGVDVIGAITLNAPVGGMNALAVEIAARERARIVWFPTFDAENEPLGRTQAKPGVPVPVWAKMQHELREQGFRPEPVRDGRKRRGL